MASMSGSHPSRSSKIPSRKVFCIRKLISDLRKPRRPEPSGQVSKTALEKTDTSPKLAAPAKGLGQSAAPEASRGSAVKTSDLRPPITGSLAKVPVATVPAAPCSSPPLEVALEAPSEVQPMRRLSKRRSAPLKACSSPRRWKRSKASSAVPEQPEQPVAKTPVQAPPGPLSPGKSLHAPEPESAREPLYKLRPPPSALCPDAHSEPWSMEQLEESVRALGLRQPTGSSLVCGSAECGFRILIHEEASETEERIFQHVFAHLRTKRYRCRICMKYSSKIIVHLEQGHGWSRRSSETTIKKSGGRIYTDRLSRGEMRGRFRAQFSACWTSPSKDLPEVTSEPSAAQAEPSAALAEPSAARAEPSAALAEPSAVQAEPSAVRAEPSAGQAEPSAAQAEPSAAQAEPFAVQAEPSAVQAEPSAVQAEPSAGQAEPSAAQAEPSAAQAEPFAVQAEPSAVQAEPSAGQAEPSAGQAEPSGAQAEASAALAEPFAAPAAAPAGGVAEAHLEAIRARLPKISPASLAVIHPEVFPAGSRGVFARECIEHAGAGHHTKVQALAALEMDRQVYEVVGLRRLSHFHGVGFTARRKLKYPKLDGTKLRCAGCEKQMDASSFVTHLKYDCAQIEVILADCGTWIGWGLLNDDGREVPLRAPLSATVRKAMAERAGQAGYKPLGQRKGRALKAARLSTASP